MSRGLLDCSSVRRETRVVVDEIGLQRRLAREHRVAIGGSSFRKSCVIRPCRWAVPMRRGRNGSASLSHLVAVGPVDDLVQHAQELFGLRARVGGEQFLGRIDRQR